MPTSEPLLVGITGGIGAGKSTIREIFSVLGVPVYDADSRAKTLMTEDAELVRRIKTLFGNASYVDGQLNRVFLAENVFSDPAQLARLNELVHPAVGRDFSDWVARNAWAAYVLKEAALLFETGSYKSLDFTILVQAPESMRVKRVLARDPHRTETQVREIMSRQLSDAQKAGLASEVIANDESDLIIPKVLALHEKLTKMAAKKARRGA